MRGRDGFVCGVVCGGRGYADRTIVTTYTHIYIHNMRFNKEDDEGEGEEPTADSADNVRNMAIVTPRPCDILCGAGYETAQHHGNVVFRRIVRKHLDAYLAATCKKSKMKASRAILHEVFDTGARFLKKDSSRRPSGGWYVADIKVGKDKISHCLRLLKMSRINGSDYAEEMMHVPRAEVSGRQSIVAPTETISSSSSSHLQSLSPYTGLDENNDDDHNAPPEQDDTTRYLSQEDPKPCHGDQLKTNYSPISANTTSSTRRGNDGETARAIIRSMHVDEPTPGRDSWSSRARADRSFESRGQPARRQSGDVDDTGHQQEQYQYYPQQRRSSSSSPPPQHRYWNYSIPATSSSSHGVGYGIGQWDNSTRRDEETIAVGRGMDHTEGGYWFNEETPIHSSWNHDEEDRRKMVISDQQLPQQRHHSYNRTDNLTNCTASRVTSNSNSRNEYPRGHPYFFLPVNSDAETVLLDYSARVPRGRGPPQSCTDEPYYRNNDDYYTGPSRRHAGGTTVEGGHGDMLLGVYYGGPHHRAPPASHYHGTMYPYPPTFPPADHRESLPLMVRGYGSGQVLYVEDQVWAPPPPPAYPALPSVDDAEYDCTTISKTTFRKRRSHDRSEANCKLPRID